MDLVLLFIGFFLMLIGILGSFIPVLPGPPISWFGLLLIHLTQVVESNWWFLGVTLAVAVLATAIDYIVPILGAKKFGGSRAGMIGTSLGLLLAIIFPIFGLIGIVVWPFIGALVGELINRADFKKATRAAFGSFMGFLSGTLLKFVVTSVYLFWFIYLFWVNKQGFFAF